MPFEMTKNDAKANPPNPLFGQISQLNRRLRLIEEQITSIREHINLVEGNITKRDKSATQELNSFSEELNDFRSNLREIQESIEQITGNLNRFASREEVKVLERYINAWNPMNFLTKEEVEELIENKLKKE